MNLNAILWLLINKFQPYLYSTQTISPYILWFEFNTSHHDPQNHGLTLLVFRTNHKSLEFMVHDYYN